MGSKKQLTPVIDPTAGLNVSTNPVYLPPGAMVEGENWIIAKPAGFKTGLSEVGHALQTRPPIKQSFTDSFGFVPFPTATEIKPLVGSTVTAADAVPAQWQSIAICVESEGWVATGGGGTDTIGQTTGLTKSDGNNISLTLNMNESPLGQPLHSLSVTLLDGLTKGNVGNNSTMLYIDYTELYATAGSFNQVGALTLKIGKDSSNYIAFDLPVTTPSTSGPNRYSTFRYSKNLREFDSKTGTMSFGELVSNILYCEVVGQTIADDFTIVDPVVMFSIDHIRLDVDYLGFFGDFQSQQPYQQHTINTLDLSTPAALAKWSIGTGFYPERRLSIGNGCLAYESDVNSSGGTCQLNFSPDLDTTVAGFPQTMLVDVRFENFGGTLLKGQVFIRLVCAGGDYTANLSPKANADGNHTLAFAFPGDFVIDSSPDPSAIQYMQIVTGVVNGQAEPNSFRAYVSNIRFAPYDTTSNLFTAQSGNLRDINIYESTNGGAEDQFIFACGDALFLGQSGLAPASFYIQGGFTNWSPPSHVFDKPFCGVIAVNPAFEGTGVASSGSFVFGGQPSSGDQIVINGQSFKFVPTGTVVVDPDQIIIGGSTAATVANAAITVTAFFVSAYLATVDLSSSSTLNIAASSVGVFANTIPISAVSGNITASGTTLTGGVDPFGQPENLEVIVNGVDGIWTVGVIKYPLAGGGIYRYPVVNQVDTRPFSSIEVFNGRVLVSGDPATPNDIFYSDDENCTKYQPGNFIPLDLQGIITTGDSIKSLRKYEDVLIIGRSTGAFILYGDSPYNYSIKQTSANFGPISSRHVIIANRRTFFLGFDGVYEFNNYQTKKISDPIDSVFKTGDMQLIRSSFLSYNPIRQVLIVNLIHEYMNDPIVGLGEGTYSVERYVYSLEKSVWSRMRQAEDLSIFNPFSAVYFGGESQAPAFYESSLTLLEWDNGPDSVSTVCTAKFAPVNCGNPRQLKTFDKVLMHALDMPSAGFTIGYSMRLNYPGVTNLAGTSYDDNDGYIEEELDSGLISRQLSIQVQTTVQNGALTLDQGGYYTRDNNNVPTSNNQDGSGGPIYISAQTPCQLLEYSLSYFNGEQI